MFPFSCGESHRKYLLLLFFFLWGNQILIKHFCWAGRGHVMCFTFLIPLCFIFSVTYVPALTKYSSSEFAALVESQADEKTFTLVFAEESVSY